MELMFFVLIFHGQVHPSGQKTLFHAWDCLGDSKAFSYFNTSDSLLEYVRSIDALQVSSSIF